MGDRSTGMDRCRAADAPSSPSVQQAARVHSRPDLRPHGYNATTSLRGRGAGEPAGGRRVRRAGLGDLIQDRGRRFSLPRVAQRNSAQDCLDLLLTASARRPDDPAAPNAVAGLGPPALSRRPLGQPSSANRSASRQRIPRVGLQARGRIGRGPGGRSGQVLNADGVPSTRS